MCLQGLNDLENLLEWPRRLPGDLRRQRPCLPLVLLRGGRPFHQGRPRLLNRTEVWETLESIREADRLILPLKPSMVDIRATLPAVEMVKANLGKDARAFVLWNMVKPGTRISRELESLEAMIGLPVLKGQVPERIGFTYATLQGYEAISGEDRELLQRIVLEFII